MVSVSVAGATRWPRWTGTLVVAAAVAACGDVPLGVGGSGSNTIDQSNLVCSIPADQILSGGPPKDGIPALTDPPLVEPGDRTLNYLDLDDRVIGFELDGRPVAIPLNILWWHEIVNLSASTGNIAVTHCPLTGSTLGFKRDPIDGAEVGVSGLLYMNNLVMYDRTSKESLWPQMLRGARCGPRDGTQLPMHPVIEMTYEGWLATRPTTRVVASQTGFTRDYRRYPYGLYDDKHNPQLLFPLPSPIDERRPPKERVLGIPVGDGGIAFPFDALDVQGARATVHRTVNDTSIVVFWDRSAQAAMAFERTFAGQRLTFSGGSDGFTDAETGSTWRIDGFATAGPMEGSRLAPVEAAFVAFWFAWAAFYPETELWTGDST